jgi:quercetin dioxygenase-like cupin family protein
MIDKKAAQDIYKHKRGWGYELWIENSPQYCGKLLHIEKGKKTSLHFHMVKTETMYLQSGLVRLHISALPAPPSGDPEVLEEVKKNLSYYLYQVDLHPGEKILIPRRQIHRIEAIEESDLFEFSTEHFEHDSIRIEKGD